VNSKRAGTFSCATALWYKEEEEDKEAKSMFHTRGLQVDWVVEVE